MEIKDIATRLARDAESVCRELLPNGKKEGNEWVDDPGAGKIKVHLQGDKAGIWSHFGGDGAGDLLDLYVKVRGGTIGDALDWGRARLGIEKPAFVGPQKKDYRRPQIPAQAKQPVKTQDVDSVEFYLRQGRGLMPATLAAFRVAEAPFYAGEKDGKPYQWPGPWILFPFLRPGDDGKNIIVNIKWLHLKRKRDENGKERKVMVQERDCEPGLFGWQAASPLARHAIIKEGEIDAMTGHQYLAQLGRSEQIAVFSVPAGCGRGEKQAWIEQEWDRLERFEDICICFDGDKEGQNKVALEEIVHRLGSHRVRIMKLPHKDTNECWVEHGMSAEEYFAAWQAARPMAPDELRSAASYVDEVLDEFYPPGDEEPGIPLPWRRMSWIRIRRCELSAWTGYNNHGKTIVLNQVAMHLCDRGERVCIASPEMPPSKLLERSTRQVSRQRRPSAAHIRRVHHWYDGRLWIYDDSDAIKPERVIEVFRYARRRFGCTFFVIDSFMRLGIDDDDYNRQKEVVDNLVNFARSEDCHVALVAHSRKGKDASKAPGRMDVKGAGAITDLAQNVFIVWRNEDKEQKLSSLDDDQTLSSAKKEEKRADLVNKPDAILSVDKQRFGTGQIGQQQLWFDRDAVSFKERMSANLPAFDTVPVDYAAQAESDSL